MQTHFSLRSWTMAEIANKLLGIKSLVRKYECFLSESMPMLILVWIICSLKVFYWSLIELFFWFKVHVELRRFHWWCGTLSFLIIVFLTVFPNFYPKGNANLPLASGGMIVCELFVTSQFLYFLWSLYSSNESSR